MAYLTYATADTRPTPILRTAFFSSPNNVMKEMREQPHECGVGQTTSGGGQGMAALEGIVTALEVCHSITILCSPPENIRPFPATVFYGAIPSPNPNAPVPHVYTCCRDVAVVRPHSMVKFSARSRRISSGYPPRRLVSLLRRGASLPPPL